MCQEKALLKMPFICVTYENVELMKSITVIEIKFEDTILLLK